MARPPHANGVPASDSWIEISSQPSSSSLSSVNDEIVTTGLRVQQEPTHRRRRRVRHGHGAPSHLNITSRAPSTSSQEEYEESESESDQVMTSSSEGLRIPLDRTRSVKSPALESTASDDEGDDRTAINYPINNDHAFTPQPNAFSHPSAQLRNQSVPGSYFPKVSDRPTSSRHSTNRHSYPPRQQHSPYNVVSPGYNAAADHDAALRASLSTLISFAGAARGLPKKSTQTSPQPPRVSTRPEPSSLRMVPESALRADEPDSPLQPRIPAVQMFDETAVFKPTIRRTSTSTTASVDSRTLADAKSEGKRKVVPQTSAGATSASKDRRVAKKQRRASYGAASTHEFFVTPTLFTWVVVAGVGVFISALSFTAGYAIGKERGMMEVSVGEVGEVSSCAREVGRTGMGLRKLKFGAAVGVGA